MISYYIFYAALFPFLEQWSSAEASWSTHGKQVFSAAALPTQTVYFCWRPLV